MRKRRLGAGKAKKQAMPKGTEKRQTWEGNRRGGRSTRRAGPQGEGSPEKHQRMAEGRGQSPRYGERGKAVRRAIPETKREM